LGGGLGGVAGRRTRSAPGAGPGADGAAEQRMP
jgi:hypothetical protein